MTYRSQETINIFLIVSNGGFPSDVDTLIVSEGLHLIRPFLKNCQKLFLLLKIQLLFFI